MSLDVYKRQTMTRGDLVDRVWTDGAEYVDENALSVTIKRLRDKLGAQKYIKTVYGLSLIHICSAACLTLIAALMVS